MQRNLVEKLGERAVLAGINPLRKPQESRDPVLGFDTEYDSKTRRLVCYQLAGENGAGLWAERLTLANLERRARSLIGEEPESVWLVTYWSYAELQFLPVIKQSREWRLYGSGSFDCTFDCPGGLTIRVFDLARFFERSGLSKVATSFGYEKLDFDTRRVTRASLKNPRFREYAIHDARLCYQIVGDLRAQFLPLGADPLISKTAAGVSATVFRRQYVPEEIRCKLPKARVAGMLACWGGRAEAFRRGRFPQVFEYDLESAYPRAAVSIGKFPEGDDLQSVESLGPLLRRTGFGRVIFRFPDDTPYPCLPVVTNYAQIYPLAGVSWATTFELERARELGASLELLEGYGYTGGSSALADMMTWALEMRKGSTGARSVAAKLMANSLIGKLAQRRTGLDVDDLREWAEIQAISIHDLVQLSTAELQTLGLEQEAKIGSCFAPEWNALVTGHVRARLSRILADTSPVYCATDSVWTTRPIPERARPSDLGLKRQGAAIVVRTRLGGIWGETKGSVHLAHHSIWTRKAGIRLLEGLGRVESIRYYSRRAVKLRESLRTRIRMATFLRELRQGNTSWDEKRRLHSNGETSPWPDVDAYLTARKEIAKCHPNPTRRRKLSSSSGRGKRSAR